MNWLFIAILSPLLWTITCFIEKFLISKYFKSSIGTLVIYSSLIGLPVAILIAFFNPRVLSLNWTTSIFIILNSSLYIIYLFPYFKALSKADTSVVVPIFQTIPVFSYFLAFFILKETLSGMQIIGSLLIILGAVGISLKFKDKKIHLTKDVLFLQLLASFIVALNYLFFKFFAIKLDFWTVSFWQYLGFIIFGLILLIFVKSYRRDFILSFKKNSGSIIALNAVNEILNIVAMIIFTFATLLAPLALVWVINGFQPLFAFLIGIGLTLFFPHLIKEDLRKKIILQKIFFILLMFFGAYLLKF
ncbi:MAG: EamA family transporter [Patescibacteria group bacterium]